MSDSDTSGIVYVLSNDAIPNIIKIGRTSGESVERRVAELSRATGVPLPFTVVVARSVHDARVVERALHVAFGPDRVNPAREFFAIDAHRAVAIINAFPGSDMLPLPVSAVEEAVEAREPGTLAAIREFQSRRRRPPLNFAEMGIPIGSVLTHLATGQTAEVVESRRVNLKGDVMSLTRAHRLISGIEYAVAPGRHWMYNQKTISEWYDATYPFTDE